MASAASRIETVRRFTRASLVAMAFLLVMTGCGPETTTPSGKAAKTTVTIPDVIGKRLSDAEAALKSAGLKDIAAVDGTGRGREVIDPDNWTVDTQSPKAGTATSGSTKVTLTVSRPSDASGPPKPTAGVVPKVVCMNLQDAQNEMQAAGFYNLGSQDGSGQGRMQILDRDWVVVKQSVAAGTKPGPTTRITLTSVKYGESTGSSGCKS
jgi:PASTA domain